ncbi:MAG: adenosine deaminase [Chloroflexi bacterium]|nr:adenosine deaminase [Chloroflexota bacterium]
MTERFRVQRPQLDIATVDLLQRMPKAELHLHLDGSLRPQTALDLARARGSASDLDVDAMRSRLSAPARCADQAELLRAFALPIEILQDGEALARTTAELVEDVALDGTLYTEMRWAPALHTRRGLSLRDGIRAVVDGARAGIVTAAGDGHEVTIRLIAVAMRSHDPDLNADVASQAARFRGEGLSGFDLAGPEAAHPDPLTHRRAFEIARGGGLGITVHAGEWGGAGQVRRALSVDPTRIAHGAPAADDPSLVAELIARGVTLDLCPTSNLQAGLVGRLEDHPLPRLVRAGVPATLSTDDRTVSDLTLVREYERALTTLGLTLSELWRVNRHALEVAFLQDDEGLRTQLLRTFDDWAADEPAITTPSSA